MIFLVALAAIIGLAGWVLVRQWLYDRDLRG